MPILLAIIAVSYLWGAIPSAYLVARYVKGIDIRDYGSGNVGAANLSEQMGRWVGTGLGSFDTLVKGTLPIVIVKLMDQGLAVQTGAGIAAIAGHCWSPYIGFTGGRGVATSVGVLVGFRMWQELVLEAVILGLAPRLVSRDTGLWTLLSMLALPMLAYAFRRPAELIYMSGAIALVLMVKRLTANWERPGGEHGLARVLLYRLVWDRDVPRKEEWTSRRPSTADGSESDDH